MLASVDGYPEGTRIIVRCERPHPGAQLSLYDLDEDMCHQVFLTNTLYGEGSLQHLEVRLPCPAVHRGSHKNVTRSGAILGGDHVGTPMRRARCKQGGTCHQVCTTRDTAPARGKKWRLSQRRLLGRSAGALWLTPPRSNRTSSGPRPALPAFGGTYVTGFDLGGSASSGLL